MDFENEKDADYAAEINAGAMAEPEEIKVDEPLPPDPAGAALCVTSGFSFLVQSYVTRATESFELALHYDPNSTDAYLGLLLADNNLCSMSDLTQTSKHFWESKYYEPLCKLASPVTLALLKENRARIEAEEEKIRAEREVRREKTSAFLKKHRVALVASALALIVLTTLSSLFFGGVFGDMFADEERETATTYFLGTTFELQPNGEGYTVTGYTHNNPDYEYLYIPETHKGRPITAIGDYAFDYSDYKGISIPDSVTSVGDGAFYNCVRLTSVTIPDSVTSIGNLAFAFCHHLTDVTIGNGVTSISGSAFFNCGSLDKVTIPDSVTSIGGYAFDGCYNLAIVFYSGTTAEWSEVSISLNNSDLTSATIYYYSESKPTEAGNFWHYVDGVPNVW